MSLGEITGAAYRAFMKFAGWYGRLVTSAALGFMAALALCLVGGRLWSPHDEITAALLIVALPLWITVSVISYKFLKPEPQD
jgi:4-hydroxybenzoate polyprenyltransferase